MLVPFNAPQPAATSRDKRVAVHVSRLAESDPRVQQDAQAKLVMYSQRGSNGFYDSAWAFPGQRPGCEKNVLEEASCSVVQKWQCRKLLNCTSGTCTHQLNAFTVLRLRSDFCHACPDHPSRQRVLLRRLETMYDRGSGKWSTTKLAVSDYTSVDVCPSAYALILGFTESALRKAVDEVKTSTKLVQVFNAPLATSLVPLRPIESASELDSLLRGYVHQHLLKIWDDDPAPLGASRSSACVVRKQSAAQHWKTCLEHFAKLGRPLQGGNARKLATIMAAEKRLVQKTVNSHPKCQCCVRLAARLEAAFNMKGPAGHEARQNVAAEIRKHDNNHMGERAVFDDNSYLSIAYPHRVWVIVADAATQRNFSLPKLHGRPAKDLVGAEYWRFKLMGTYAPGFGFTPYLLHNSSVGGDNLVWTVIWDTIKRMKDFYGFTPDELFILLDNTTGDNKNLTMIGVCAWLVATGKFRKVRVFFLMVGHTHVIIDQIFGVITTRIRPQEIMLPRHMCSAIDAILAKNPQYNASKCTWLRSVFDWKTFVRSTCKLNQMIKNICHKNNFAVDAQGYIDEAYNGMHDIIFLTTEPSRRLNAVMSYRRSSSQPRKPAKAKSSFSLSTRSWLFSFLKKGGLPRWRHQASHLRIKISCK